MRELESIIRSAVLWAGAAFVLGAVACGKTVALGHGEREGAGSKAGGASGPSTSSAGGEAADDGSSDHMAGEGGVPSSGGLPNQGGAADDGLVVVNGQVVTLTEQPLAGVVVEIAGNRLISGADGTFQTQARLPYDVVVHHAPIPFGAPAIQSDVYLGVTRPELKLYTHLEGQRDRYASLDGQISGGASVPLSEQHGLVLVYQGRDFAITSRNYSLVHQPQGSNGRYAVSEQHDRPRWFGPDATEALLFAIQSHAGEVTGVGSKRVSLVDGSVARSPEADLVLGPPQHRDFVIDVKVPAGATLVEVHSDGFAFTLNVHPDNATTFPHTVKALVGIPDELGISVQARCLVDDHSVDVSRWVKGDAPGVDLECGAPPKFVGPPSLFEYQPRATVFEFTPAANAVTTLRFCYQPLSDLREAECVTVHTDESSVALSKLIELGLESFVPPGKLIRWDVVSRHEALSVDAFLDPARIARAHVAKAYAAAGSEATDRWFSYE